ncbi:cysteine hydrolase family protein [Rhodococcoides kyotonense]|uniref:Nicotinamidase-related amidase n=1 Tax=Rhodococcoides kyotonense TaxID=398843 RepID=A0A239H1Q1_9NOCA|nr:isochorismatase family cysteine hydrolase [Rhodococcus kyotonensis]SNS75055.1 Nicotinamidase-related amidase [Rhodococcus kyotonensis]
MELDPRSTALIVVHTQGDVVGPDGAFADFFYSQVVERDVIAKIAGLADDVRSAGGTVVYTRVAWKPDLSDLEVNSPILGIVQQSGCLQEGAPLADIVEPLAPKDGDIVVTHQRVGGFQNSTLDEVLEANGITTTVFAGVATNFSVEGTARTASDLGYRTVVVEDACSAATPESHTASIESLGLLAEIVSIDDVTAALHATVSGTA